MATLGRKSYWTLTCLYVGLLTAGSLLPSGPDAPGGWDKSITPSLQNAMHAPAYSVLIILLVMAMKPPGQPAGPGLAMLAGTGCCAYGVLLEYLQTIVPGRTGSASDALLNLAGVAAGLGLIIAVRLMRRQGRAPDASQSAPLPDEPAEGGKLSV